MEEVTENRHYNHLCASARSVCPEEPDASQRLRLLLRSMKSMSHEHGAAPAGLQQADITHALLFSLLSTLLEAESGS